MLALAEPFVPLSPDVVLERVAPSSAPRPIDQEIAFLRGGSAANTQGESALQLARLYADRARMDGEVRDLGRALRLLEDAESPSAEHLILRGIVRQSLHDFAGGEEDLLLGLKADPSNGQGWLSLGSMALVRGEYELARRAVLQSVRTGDPLAGAVLAAGLAGVTTDPEPASRSLRRVLEAHAHSDPAVGAWGWAVLGDLEAQLGRFDDAERHWRLALENNPPDAATRAALADVLIAQARRDDALSLLEGFEKHDALLLRKARVLRGANDKAFAEAKEELGVRFGLLRARGGHGHEREEAYYWLHVANDASRAVTLGSVNWAMQKELVDARLLVEAAIAAGSPEAATPVLEWAKANQWHDARLSELTTSPAAERRQ